MASPDDLRAAIRSTLRSSLPAMVESTGMSWAEWADFLTDRVLAAIAAHQAEPEPHQHTMRREGDGEYEAFHFVCEDCGFDDAAGAAHQGTAPTEHVHTMRVEGDGEYEAFHGVCEDCGFDDAAPTESLPDPEL